MKELLNVVLITNVLAALVVLLLSKYIAFFASTSLSDFLFFIVIVIWGIAGLTWEGSNDSRNWELDPAAKKAKEMVAGHDFGADFDNQKRQNYQFGLIMFIAGLPALLGCILLIFIF